MDCLKVIGLRGICDAETRLVVNDLPGISLKMVSNLTDEPESQLCRCMGIGDKIMPLMRLWQTYCHT